MNSEKEAKIAIVKEISKKIADAKAVIIAEYAGISVNDLQILRKQLKSLNAEIKVYKNRLFKLAARKTKLNFSSALTGPNIYVFSVKDEISPIKILTNFAKKNNFLKLKFATYEGKIIDRTKIYEIATLPSFEEALIILANSMMGMLQMLSFALHMLAVNKK